MTTGSAWYGSEAQVREGLGYYGLEGEDLEGAIQAYMERVQDGDPPALAEFAEAWMELS